MPARHAWCPFRFVFSILVARIGSRRIEARLSSAKRRKRQLIVITELLAGCMLLALLSPASAQFFDNFLSGGSRNPFFGQPHARPHAQARPAQPAQTDYSRPPPPPEANKNAAPDLKRIIVMGDLMADWLAYGLEEAFAEAPEISVVGKVQPLSRLVDNAGRQDPTGYINWPAAARDILAKEPATFIVMMIGLADRDAIRVPETAQPAPKPGAKPESWEPDKAGQPDAASTSKPSKPSENCGSAETAADQGAADPRAPAVSYDFKTEKWAELYGKRIDETIAALKSKGVPVFWVGLPPLLGARSTADMQYLDNLFRIHAEKAGISYIDVWDGFADDAGRFTMQGPDYDGQIRGLRTPDGVYFTPAGARKLALYVEREIRRALTPKGRVAVPLPREPLLQPPVASLSRGGGTPRPLAGPVIPLNASVEPSKSEELLGAATPKQTVADAVANRVLVNGDPMPAPAGRADDFAWPRRAPAPVGADPVVAMTNLPMTPMVAGNGAQQTEVEVRSPAAPAQPLRARNRLVRGPAPSDRTVRARARAAQARVVRERPRLTQRYRYAQYPYPQYRQQNSFFFFFGQ